MPQSGAQPITEILQRHLDELAALWGERQAALKSSAYTLRELRKVQERSAAHLEGLMAGGDATIPLAETALAGDDPSLILAAAFTLLKLQTPAAAAKVMDALMEAKPEGLEGIRTALCQGPIDLLQDRLREALRSAPSPQAAVAAEVLAFHRQLDPNHPRLTELFADENPEVRRAAWRVAAIVDAT
jgi:hypothetical protein